MHADFIITITQTGAALKWMEGCNDLDEKSKLPQDKD